MLPLSSVTFVAENPVCAMFLSIQHLWQQAESKSAGFVNNLVTRLSYILWIDKCFLRNSHAKITDRNMRKICGNLVLLEKV